MFTMYHNSNDLFDFPDFSKAGSNKDHHYNSALGFWGYSEKAQFDNDVTLKYLYEVKFDGVILEIPIGQFFRLSQNTEDFQALREKLLQKYDIIAIREDDENVGISMYIILHPDAIKSFEQYNPYFDRKP